MENDYKLAEQRKYAWNYFELHARQRMALFNFFVLMSALLTTALAASLKKDGTYHVLGFVLGMSLVAISFVFWKVDQRVRYLLRHAEEAFKILEKQETTEEKKTHEPTALFSLEEQKTAELRAQLRQKHPFQPWRWHMSYYQSFRLVYIVFALIGTLGMIYAIVTAVFGLAGTLGRTLCDWVSVLTT